jgi:hypothetical protein
VDKGKHNDESSTCAPMREEKLGGDGEHCMNQAGACWVPTDFGAVR